MLTRGITGFRGPHDPPIEVTDVESAMSTLSAAAHQIGGRVGQVTRQTPGRSYTAVSVVTPSCGRFAVLVSGQAPIVAFAQSADRPPRFVSCPEMAAAIRANGWYRVLDLTDLAERITPADRAILNDVENERIDRYGSTTIGDLIFNRWE